MVPWWNKHLEVIRKSVRKLERKAFNKKLRRPERTLERELALSKYRQCLTHYNKEVRKAKSLSWKSKSEEVVCTNTLSGLHKLLSKKQQNSLGSMKKPDGTYTNTIRETMEFMTKVHFPGRTL